MKNNYLEIELYKEVKENPLIFDFLQNGSLDGIWYWDLETPENEWMSPKFWETLGYDPERKKHLASEWQDLIFKEDLEVALDNFKKHFDNPEYPYDQIVRYKHKDGSTVWVRCRGLIIRDDKNKPIRMLGAHTNITNEKNSQNSLEYNFKLMKQAEQIGKIGFYERNWQTGEGYWSEGLFKLLGLDPKGTPSHSAFLEFVIEEEREQVEAYVKSTIEEKTKMDITFRIKRADEKIVYIHGTGENFYDSEGKPLSTLGLFQDITEQIKSEQALRESEAKYRTIFESSGMRMAFYKTDGTLILCNKMMANDMGGLPEDYIGESIYDLHSKKNADLYMKRINKVVSSEVPLEFETLLELPIGCKWFYSSYSRVVDEDGRILGVHIASFDITDKKQSEQALRENEARFRAMIEKNNSVILLINPKNGHIEFANQSASDFYGWSIKELEKKNIYDINTLPKELIEIEMERACNEEKNQFTFKHKLRSGIVAEVTVNSTKIDIDDKNLLLSIIHDETKKLEAEQALRESEARYRALYHYSGVAIGYFKPDGTVISFNNMALKKMGKPDQECSGKSLHEVFPENEADLYLKRMKAVISSDKPQEYIDEETLPNGSNWFSSTYSKVVGDNGQVLGVQIVVVDITEKKSLESEKNVLESHLRNQQKLESIGTLASGVAHEINNPINGILNYAQIILDSDIEDESVKEYASEIITETERVSNIVKNLLEFSRQQKGEHNYAKIDDIISKTLSLVNTVFKHDQIEINLDIEENIPNIKCFSQQIQQVIMNLLTNARDALNLKYPGYDENKKINVRCESYTLDNRRWLRLTVEDYGTGISKDIIDNIFDPFFTTKGKFKGTGLGLSISYGIVKEHHGDINVESKEGKFTRFIVNLPCDNGLELE